MRIIKFIFRSLLFLSIAGGLAFLISREVLLFMGVSKIKSSLSTLSSASVQKSYFNKCKEKGSVIIGEDGLATLQLRFISSNEYLLEILCSQLSIDPIVIGQDQLPLLVTKVDGRSGIVWGDDRSGLTLEILGRQKSIGIEDRLITSFPDQAELGVEPANSCEGYGFSCCNLESQQGVGKLFSTVTDCPRSCYGSCESRPVVLAFNTQPFLDLKERVVSIESGESVDFSFVVDAGSSHAVSVKIDYGDGQKDVFSTLKQRVTHLYTCSRDECTYRVRLTVEDERGITAAELPVMSLVVKVKS